MVSLTSQYEKEFISDNVDARPTLYQMWIGLEKNPITGNKN